MALHLRAVVLPDEHERDVFVEDGRFVAEPSRDVTSAGEGLWAIPGLVDVHVHLALSGPGDRGPGSREQVERSLGDHLSAGVLAVREPGTPAGPSDVLPSVAPRVVTGARFVAAPGRTHPGWSREVSDERLAEAADEAARTAPWVKVIGDWVGDRGRWETSFSAGALAEAVRRAHDLGAKLAVHAFLPETIEASLEAGADSIEHGLLAEAEHLDAMAEGGVAFVPTMTIAPGLRGFARQIGATAEDVERIAAGAEAHPRRVRAAVERGVRVLAGTDGGVTRHGRVADEVRRMVRAGVAPIAALGAASWEARRFLALPSVEPGAPADVVAFERDPREDPRALAEPARIILGGSVVA